MGGAAWPDALIASRIKEDMQRPDEAMLDMGYVESGDRHRAIGLSGGPLQTPNAIVAEGRLNGGEDEIPGQMAQQLGHGLRDGFVALHRAIGLVQDGVGGV